MLAAVWFGHSKFAQSWVVVTMIIEASIIVTLGAGKLKIMKAEQDQAQLAGARDIHMKAMHMCTMKHLPLPV